MANLISTLFIPGFRLINGSTLNDMIAKINGAFAGTQSVTSIVATGNVSAAFFNESAATGLTAAGTTRADALALTKGVNVIGTAAASTGVVLPAAATVGIGGSVIVFNDGASPIKVYAAGSDTIDGTAGATGVTLTNALRCEYYVTAALTFKSAKLGATST